MDEHPKHEPRILFLKNSANGVRIKEANATADHKSSETLSALVILHTPYTNRNSFI